LSASGNRAALALFAAASLMLDGCNMVLTKDPMFSAADAAGAPPMRPGVWDRDKPDANCVFDQTEPLSTWPSCAAGFVVGADGTVGGFNEKRVWSTAPFIVASGDPRVVEIHFTTTDDAALMPSFYLYSAVKPTKFDAQGRIIGADSWPVLCGPPPPADAKAPDGSQRTGTLTPWPGLTMDASASNCAAASKDAIRAAARASRQWTTPDNLSTTHWLREGDK